MSSFVHCLFITQKKKQTKSMSVPENRIVGLYGITSKTFELILRIILPMESYIISIVNYVLTRKINTAISDVHVG